MLVTGKEIAMHLPFRRTRSATATLERPVRAHVIESGFCYARCRFELTCTCGASYDTSCIDEALEFREMHLKLAPLSDQLSDEVPAA